MTRVGADFVESDGTVRVLARLDVAVLVEQPTFPPPIPVASTLLEELTRAAAASPTVIVDTPDGRVKGDLTAVARDHLAIKTWTGRILVALNAVRSVEFHDRA